MTPDTSAEAVERRIRELQEAGFDNGAATLLALLAERDALQDRLEMRHIWKFVDGHPLRVPVKPGSIPDGIACRDETIRRQDEGIAALRAERDRLAAEVGRLREALRFTLPFANEAMMKAMNNAPRSEDAYKKWASDPTWLALKDGVAEARAALAGEGR